MGNNALLTYVKQRKHNKSQQRKITRRLIKLLGKILSEIRKVCREHESEDMLTAKEKDVVGIITKVYRQQKNHFENDNPRESIPDRILSISKPYVRPIVRGKEVIFRQFIHTYLNLECLHSFLSAALFYTKQTKFGI